MNPGTKQGAPLSALTPSKKKAKNELWEAATFEKVLLDFLGAIFFGAIRTDLCLTLPYKLFLNCGTN